MKWSHVTATERGKTYTDHVAGPFRIGQGYDEAAKRAGEPHTLTERGRFVGTFPSTRAARRAAEARR